MMLYTNNSGIILMIYCCFIKTVLSVDGHNVLVVVMSDGWWLKFGVDVTGVL